MARVVADRRGAVVARPTTVPSRKARSAELSAGRRVRSSTIRNTSASGRPNASAAGHPVNASAIELRKVTRPSPSVLMTASPMLARVICSSSRSPAGPGAIRWRERWMAAAFCTASERNGASSSSPGVIQPLREPSPRRRWDRSVDACR
jgi:hypothetical protein